MIPKGIDELLRADDGIATFAEISLLKAYMIITDGTPLQGEIINHRFFSQWLTLNHNQITAWIKAGEPHA